MMIVKKEMEQTVNEFNGKVDANGECLYTPTTHTETRYVITDDYGRVIDDAQGYGYKTYSKAIKCGYWKYGRDSFL